jgi:hypothetical protein
MIINLVPGYFATRLSNQQLLAQADVSPDLESDSLLFAMCARIILALI